MYCVYLDKDVDPGDMNREHIIPLSLGGADGFEILVDSLANSTIGSDIDGAIANDFLMLFPRREYDARGHSNKEPFPLAKNSRLISSGKPVQVAFKKEEIKFFSPIERKNLAQNEVVGEAFESEFKLDSYSRIRFTAKVALAAGYFIYGDLFRNNVDHSEIRKLLNFDRSTVNREDFEGSKTKGWFWPFPVADKDENDHQLYQFLAKYLDCSFVLVIPGPANIGLIVGILGEVVGVLNCAANTDDFPLGEDHDLGHVVATKGRKVLRMSYRELVRKAAEASNFHFPEG